MPWALASPHVLVPATNPVAAMPCRSRLLVFSTIPLRSKSPQIATAFISAGKRHREPHCIARKPSAWPLSGIRQYYRRHPRRRPGKDALHRHRTCAQHCSPMQRILREVYFASFGSTRERCLCPDLTGRRPLRRRRTAFLILCHKPQPFCVVSDCPALEQHCNGRQKSGWQQREAKPE